MGMAWNASDCDRTAHIHRSPLWMLCQPQFILMCCFKSKAPTHPELFRVMKTLETIIQEYANMLLNNCRLILSSFGVCPGPSGRLVLIDHLMNQSILASFGTFDLVSAVKFGIDVGLNMFLKVLLQS